MHGPAAKNRVSYLSPFKRTRAKHKQGGVWCMPRLIYSYILRPGDANVAPPAVAAAPPPAHGPRAPSATARRPAQAPGPVAAQARRGSPRPQTVAPPAAGHHQAQVPPRPLPSRTAPPPAAPQRAGSVATTTSSGSSGSSNSDTSIQIPPTPPSVAVEVQWVPCEMDGDDTVMTVVYE